MATNETSEPDPYSFDVHFDLEDDGHGYHRMNKGKEIQRAGVVDDSCLGLIMNSRIDQILHGHEKDGRGYSTFVVFGFRFHGFGRKRRFKEAVIKITFSNKNTYQTPEPDVDDPEVIALWPDGDLALDTPTNIQVEDARGVEISPDASVGAGVVQAGGHVNWKWEKRQTYATSDHTRLTGTIILDTSVREYGLNNCVCLTTTENSTTGSGLATDFRVAVLLHRFSETDQFTANVKMSGKADFAYNTITELRNLVGLSPKTDPVVFEPTQPFSREPMEEVNCDNLNKEALNQLANSLVTTVVRG